MNTPMNRKQADDESNDVCAACGKSQEPTGSERWTGAAGEVVMLPTFDEVWAVGETVSGDDLTLCEGCYKRGEYGTANPEDIAALHFSFGLEYLQEEDYEASADALHKALALKRTGDTLYHLAVVYGHLGNPSLEAELYRQVLAVNPQHHTAGLKVALETKEND